MRALKSIIPALLILILVFIAVEPAFAADYASITAEIEPKTDLHVGDTVFVTVTVENIYLLDLYPVSVYAPVPDGLKFESFVVPDKTLQNYDPSSGIWGIFRMRHEERGFNKRLVMTCTVLPEAEGKTITANARFNQVVIELTGRDVTPQIRAARADVTSSVTLIAPVADFTASPLTGYAPLSVHFTDKSKQGPNNWLWDFGDGATSTVKNPTHSYTKPGNYTVKLTASNREGKDIKTQNKYIIVKEKLGTGDGDNGDNGNGTGPVSGNGNGLIDAIGNLSLSDNNLLANLQKGGGGKKAYELSPDPANQSPLGIYILAALLVIGLIAMGYFYGIKNKR